MKPITLTPTESTLLIALSLFGLLVPNGLFCYYFFTDSAVTREALLNPISLVFMTEAFVLMLLFAWLLKRAGATRPGATAFVIMSLIGSMVFSVPATLYLLLNNRRRDQEPR